MLGNAQTNLISAEHILAGGYEKSGNEGVSQGLLAKMWQFNLVSLKH
jgi:hypothetical protein